MVISAIETAFKTESFNLTIRDNLTKEPETEIDIDALIKKENQKYMRIREAYESGVYTLDELKESKRIAEHNIAELKAKVIKPQKTRAQLVKKLKEREKEILTQLKSPTVTESEKNEILRSFVDKIIFDRAASAIRIFYYI